MKDVTTVEDPSASINGQTVHVGDVLRYEVSWTNGSDLVADEVSVTDAAPTGTVYVLADDGAPVSDGGIYDAEGNLVEGSAVRAQLGDDGRLRWELGSVRPGQTVRVSFQVCVSGESVSVVDNQATMTVGRNDHSTNWVHNPVEVLEGSGTVTLQLEKTLRGRPMEEGEFGFVATDTATGEQMTALAPAAPDGVAASVTFKPIVYTSGSSMEGAELQPDGSLMKRFVYAISEVNGGVDGVLYDPATFYAVVTVTDDQRGTAPANGPVTFSTMEFFEPGTYNYVIRELRGGAGGSLTYDGATFGLQVVVEQGSEGGLYVASATHTDGQGAWVETPTFHSVLDGDIVALDLNVIKSLRDDQGNGLALTPGEFGFVITDADTGEDVGVGYNDAAGNVALSTLVYSYRTVEESTAENPTPGEEATEPGEMPAESEGPGAGEKPAEPEGPAAGESPAPGEGASPAGPEPGQPAEPGQPGEPGGEGGANEPSEPAVPAEPEAPQPEVTQPEESVAAGEEPVGADDAEENADAEGFSAEGTEAGEPEGVSAASLLDLLAPAEAIADGEDVQPYTSAYLEGEAAARPASETATGLDAVEFGSELVAPTHKVESPDLGDHHYIVREVLPPGAVQSLDGSWTLNGIRFDLDRYYITVTVSDAGDGTIAAAVTPVEVWENGDPANARPITLGQGNPLEYAVFENVYTAYDPLHVTPEGTKALTGRAAEAGEFDFVARDAQGTVCSVGKTVLDAADGEASPILFSGFRVPATAGTYEYTVSELRGNDASITYSEQLFRIVVTVAPDEGGTLRATVEYADGPVAFVNAFTPKPVVAAVGGTKTLTGKALTEGEFTFRLVDAVTGETVATAANTAEGSVAFEALQFGQPGIYEYRVEEMVGNEPGVSYDTASYRAVVTVEAASDGSLTARVEHPDGYPSFKNAYTPPTTPPDKPDVPVTPPVTPPENPTTPGNPGTPGNPSNPGTSGKPSTSVPATGDETVGGGVLAGLAAAGAVLMGAGALVWFGRRRKA